jgi:AbrB family looped-hinge helix DNA binding protein
MTEIVTMSSKGQVVIPKSIREQLDIDSGSNFAVFGDDDTIVLKRLKLPSRAEAFMKVHKWGTRLAKEKGWQDDVTEKIRKGRGT